MMKMREIYKKFKNLTGFSYSDIASRLGVTKQAVEQTLRNYSITHKNANKWILTEMINESIESHNAKICELKELQEEIKRL